MNTIERKPFDVNSMLGDLNETLLQETHDSARKGPRNIRPAGGEADQGDSMGAATTSRDAIDLVQEARSDAGLLTNTRQSTHGDFRTNARLSQHLKAVFRSYDGWDHLDDVEKEAMDMMALKFSRIISGRSLERQHWEDVEGYAHLALKECK